jgi:hypothetical protein
LKAFCSDNMWIRLGSIWIVGFAIMLLAWVFSFRDLPEGVVRESSLEYYVPVKAQDAVATFFRIFLWNLSLGCIPIAIGNVVRLKNVPLGYLLAFYHWATYGVLLGTNSFVIPGPGKFLPSLETLFYGSGIYEISSYTFISSATFNLFSQSVNPTRDTASRRKLKSSVLRISRMELAVIAIAIVVLAVSNYYEAWYIFHM